MAVTTDIARVTIISTSRRIDLALPGNTTLAELLPAIVKFSGHEGGGVGDALQQWVLQRLGEDPFDPFVQVSELQIEDGETLHLRRREATMPDAAFDDVVDGIATGTEAQPAWRNRHGQVFALVALAVLLTSIPGAAAILANNVLVPLSVFGLGVITAFVAILLARTLKLRAVSGVLAWCSVVLVGFGGATMFEPMAADSASMPVTVLTAGAAVLLAATATSLGTQVTAYELMGVAVAAGLVVIVAVVAVLNPEWFIAASAIGLTLVLAFTPTLPGLSFSLAKVAMPNLPSSADALMADRQPVQADIVERAIAADRFLAGLILATGTSALVLSLPVLAGTGWAPTAFVLVAGAAMILRARSFTGRSQRLYLLGTGSLVLLLGIGRLLLTLPPVPQIVVGVGVVLIGAALLTNYAASMYDKILSPVWGRWGDIFEWLAIMALVPLALAVINLYGWAFGLAG